MAGLQWTYGQVRNYVQGSGCTKSDDRINVMMTACLQELWAQVCDDPFYRDELSVVLAEGESKVDIAQCATIVSIKVRYTIDDEEYCRTLGTSNGIPEPLCGCPKTAVDEVCEHTVKGLPTEFSILGDELCLTPCPDQEVTVEIECYREVDCTLFEVDDDGVVIWNDVDLPERYIAQLANLVLSKSYAEDGDFAAATYWEQKVRSGTQSLIDKRADRYNPEAGDATTCAPADFKVIRRGETRGCNTCKGSCCCEPEMQQILVEKVYVDCDGNPIIEEEPELEPTGKGGRLE